MSAMIDCICIICGKHHIAPARKVRLGKYKTCSHRCGRLANIVPTEQRFWSKVDRSAGPDACWPWLTGQNRGYGCFTNNGQNLRAHRFAYELTKGPIPDGLDCLHTCNNPPCCNPAHLYAGTALDNSHDTIKAGHWKGNVLPPMPGELNPKAKLTWVQVDEIRSLYATGHHTIAELGRQYGVTRENTWSIVHWYTWQNRPALNLGE
jgi:hypothetical protein